MRRHETAPEEDAAGDGPKPSRGMRGLMAPGETVLVTAVPARRSGLHKYLLSLGLYEIWRRRRNFVVTDRHVLIGTGVLHRRERSIPVRRIDEVSLVRSGLSSYVALKVDDRGQQRTELIGPFPWRTARRVSSTLVGMT